MNTQGRPSIMFVTYGGGHVDIVERILPHLPPTLDVRVLALTTAIPRLARTGVETETCRSWLPLPSYERAMEVGARLSGPVWNEDSGIPWDESCAYLGVSMLDLVEEVGERVATEQYDRLGRSAFCPVRFVRTGLERERPSLVVTTCHVRMERAATIASKELGIPTVRIEDLFGTSLALHAYAEKLELVNPSEWPDDVIVLNDAVRRRLTHAGFAEQRVHALGQPVFSDWVDQFESTDPPNWLTEWNHDERPLIAYATPARREVFRAQMDTLLALAARERSWRFVVKLHPSIPLVEFRQHYPDLPGNVTATSRDDIIEVIRACDLVVSYRSTVSVLCALVRVPQIILDPEPTYAMVPPVGSLIQHIDDPARLRDAIERALAHLPAGRSTPAAPLLENPQDASRRIAQWLEAHTVHA